jgi:hypothetical protein
MLPRTGRRSAPEIVVLSFVIGGLASGCMNQQLCLATNRTVKTLPDLQYQQVVDNLAMIAANPGYLPYLAVAGQGSIQVTDNHNSSLGLRLSSAPILPQSLGLGGSRDVTGTWSLGTITSPEKIRGMQTLYRRGIHGSLEREPAWSWIKIGCRRDVPKEACYVGRHGPVRVWIMPDGIEGLSALTLEILDVATHDDTSTGAALTEGSPNPTAKPRRNFQFPAAGPVFTPGVN